MRTRVIESLVRSAVTTPSQLRIVLEVMAAILLSVWLGVTIIYWSDTFIVWLGAFLTTVLGVCAAAVWALFRLEQYERQHEKD